jgi:hypothetical protein
MVHLSHYRLPILFMVAVFAGAALSLRQYRFNEHRHTVKREDFILLQQRGYGKKAEAYYQHLLKELDRLPDQALVDDLQRTALLVEPEVRDPENLLWKYHWAVRSRLQQRAQQRLHEILAPSVEPELN